LLSYLKLVAVYARLNFKAQLEYRGAFLSQGVATFFTNIVWVIFWFLFFTRFPVLHGWNVDDVITIWALASAGYGLANAVCGNAQYLASIIVQGQLDLWMLYPRTLLPHILLNRMSATSWGDVFFGYLVYLTFVRPSFLHFLLFTVLSLSVAMLFLGFNILAGSLSFYIGNSVGLAEQWRFAMITFSTYPAILFEGTVKLLLYTLIPAGFITYFPVLALRELSLAYAAYSIAGAFVLLTVGFSIFYHGLSRYESGNLIEMRE
jgi:ABC-2 type transport system permease protein